MVAPVCLGLTSRWAEGPAAAWPGSGGEGAVLGHPLGIARVSSGQHWVILGALPGHYWGILGASLRHFQAPLGHLWSTMGTPLRPLQGIAGSHPAGCGDTLFFAGTFIQATGKSRVPWALLHPVARPVPAWVPGCRSRAPKAWLDQPLVARARCEAGPRALPPALPDLPRVVVLSEDAVPGTLVAKVTVSCSNNTSDSPNVTLHGIKPGHPFNPIAISADPMAAATFQGEVRLGEGERARSLRAPR